MIFDANHRVNRGPRNRYMSPRSASAPGSDCFVHSERAGATMPSDLSRHPPISCETTWPNSNHNMLPAHRASALDQAEARQASPAMPDTTLHLPPSRSIQRPAPGTRRPVARPRSKTLTARWAQEQTTGQSGTPGHEAQCAHLREPRALRVLANVANAHLTQPPVAERQSSPAGAAAIHRRPDLHSKLQSPRLASKPRGWVPHAPKMVRRHHSG